ncbi:BPSL0761 family protein [Rhodanobacter sp. C05]|uniref:BPSL0761 family protein n=1 Tax=Rhodanobacter sp. C05 TaxID=1945855 RepID=UPI0009879BE9|nr:BPSL0761 family protein [Rhodanobacter sp. C05]OOG41408.1 hypothetical protein B0E51_06810 [Rhodanobacter sp. C05]
MTQPYERSWAVIETRSFLTALLVNRRIPAAVLERARTLLRHYPSGSEVFRAGWQELADPYLVLEPVFDTSIDGTPSPNWSAPQRTES